MSPRFSGRKQAVLLSAALLALASVLKLTNSLFALAAVVPVAWLARDWRQCGLNLLLFAIAGAGFSLLLGGWWWWKIWSEFANPFFPYANGLFGSHLFADFSLASERFAANSLAEFAAWPVHMLLPSRLVWTEAVAPDARFLFLALLLSLGAFKLLVSSAARSSMRADSRLVAITVCFLFAWASWLDISGNGRYFMPFVLIAGPMILGWMFFIFGPRNARVVALVVLIFAQTLVVASTGEFRWNKVKWSGQWFEADVPSTLKEQPALFVSTGMRSASYLAPWMHPDSSFVHGSGQYVIAPDTAAFLRLKNLARRYSGRVFLLFELQQADSSGAPAKPSEDSFRRSVARYGWRVRSQVCQAIRFFGVPSANVKVVKSDQGMAFRSKRFDYFHILACPIEESETDLLAYKAGEKKTRDVFAKVQRACPELLGNEAPNTDGAPGLWTRFYNRSDVWVTITDRAVQLQRMGQFAPISLGSTDLVRQGESAIQCALQGAPALQEFVVAD